MNQSTTTRNCRTFPAREAVVAGQDVPKLLYSRAQAAYALDVSVRSIDYLIANGHVQVRRIGSAVRIPAAEVFRIADQGVRGSVIDEAA
jgi:hypothetical protein